MAKDKEYSYPPCAACGQGIKTHKTQRDWEECFGRHQKHYCISCFFILASGREVVAPTYDSNYDDFQ